MKSHLGLFLVLTGSRLKGADVRKAGIATHYMSSQNILNLEKRLYESNDLDPQKIEQIVNSFDEKLTGEYDTTRIGKIFNADSLEQIVVNLEQDNSDWAKQQLKSMEKMSPLSLKIAVRQMREGSGKASLKECLEMEFLLAQKFARKSDFSEGVRALLVDKGDKPKWNPNNFRDIDSGLVDWYFKFDEPNFEKLFVANGSKL